MAEPDAYHSLLARLQKEVAADRCTLYVVDRERQEVWSKVALGLEIAEIRLRMNRGLVGYVARTGHTVNLRDAYNDPRFDRTIDQQTGYRTKTVLTMAIRDHDRQVIGVLQVLNKRSGLFSVEDETRLAGACNEVAELLEAQ